jgi:hypothetical protein
MKGPMTTQSLRGMANHGPMHWRGDRTGGNDNPSAQPDSGTFDEVAAFKKFQAGFTDLLGRSGPIDDDAMEAFTAFILQVAYPPNPIRRLDNQLTPSQQAGHDFFLNNISDFTRAGTCTSCHVFDPNANREHGVAAPGFFGTDGRYTFEAGSEPFKTPHFRNAYQKVGMFGLKTRPTIPTDDAFLGPQIRGFGFTHDGAIPTIFNFISITTDFGGFNQSPATPGGFLPGAAGELQKRQVEDFLFAFDSNLAPIVGQHYDVDSGLFLGNRRHDTPLSDASLRQRALEKGGELTYT